MTCGPTAARGRQILHHHQAPSYTQRGELLLSLLLVSRKLNLLLLSFFFLFTLELFNIYMKTYESMHNVLLVRMF